MNPTITITLKQYDQNGHIRILTVPFCLVDTGASSSYITHDCLPTQMKTNKLSSPEIVGNAFSDKITSINETLTANLIIDQHDIEISKVKFYVIRKPMTYKAIIGMNVLSNFQIDFRKDDLVFLNYLLHSERQEISTIIFESDRDHESLDILSNKRITLSPHSDRLLYVKIFGPKWPKEKFIFFPNERLTENNIFVLEHRLFARDHMVQVQNRSNSVLIIELHTRVGCIRKTSKHHNLNFLLTEKELEPYERLTHKKELKEWRIKRDLLVKHNPLDKEIEVLCKLAPKQYQKELSDILHKHSWSFSRGVSDAGLSQHFLTELKLKDTDAPVYTRPYKLDISMQEKVEKKLNELKEAGIIEPSCSAWNSPVLFVKKKDDSIRVVNNYSACGDRSVNSRLIIPKYPSLPIRSVLAKVSLAITTLKQKFPHYKVYFIGLDVRNAFYSISIREKKSGYN